MALAFKAFLIALWFMALTFPVMGIRLNLAENSVDWRLGRVLCVGAAVFFLSMLWTRLLARRAAGLPLLGAPDFLKRPRGAFRLSGGARIAAACAAGAFLIAAPLAGSFYHTNIMISAMLYIILALGLNIVVGLAGQLVLGYVSFYAIGAYAYGILYHFYGWGFWACLPISGLLAALFGLGLGFPVLRLKGDYLAIVTLGFGEITRLALLNWTSLSGGPGGISNIPKPSFFGIELGLHQSVIYIYYLALAAVVISVIVISRLKNSRFGLALMAMREDETASEAMGVNITRAKLSAFALSACWAGLAGALFAAKNSFINPSSFTFMESAMILSMVVLGGMGSISGVIAAAVILSLAPEYLRAFSEYRMLIFGSIMVIMMIFRPQGLVSGEKRDYGLMGKGLATGGRE